MTKQMNEITPPTPEANATSAPRQPSPSATQRQGWLAGLRLRPWMLKWGMNLWPPFRGAKIRLEAVSADFRYARVGMPLKLTNRNMWGVHYGGSLFSMSDPFWMLLVMNRLGPDYVVWDRAGEIDFVSPGRGDVFADFVLTEDRLAEIRELTRGGGKALVWFENQVVAEDGTLVARVRKQLYIRLKPIAH